MWDLKSAAAASAAVVFSDAEGGEDEEVEAGSDVDVVADWMSGSLESRIMESVTVSSRARRSWMIWACLMAISRGSGFFVAAAVAPVVLLVVVEVGV